MKNYESKRLDQIVGAVGEAITGLAGDLKKLGVKSIGITADSKITKKGKLYLKFNIKIPIGKIKIG